MNSPGTALITGANRGLGLAFVRAARAAGWRVVATCRQPAAASELLATGADVRALDVAEADQRQRLVTELGAVGPLALVIHNAGINSASPGAGEAGAHVTWGELTEAALLQTIRTNAIAPLLFTQELLPHLADGAKVVAISSWFASIAERDRGFNFSYSGSKALLNMYLRLAGLALAPRGIVALAVNPGWMRTDMGGARATLEPLESATAILELARRATPDMSGGFFDWNGQPHPY